jgi:hypothetical protein
MHQPKIKIFIDVAMWEHRTFDSEAFRCGKIYKCKSLLISYKLSVLSL